MEQPVKRNSQPRSRRSQTFSEAEGLQKRARVPRLSEAGVHGALCTQHWLRQCCGMLLAEAVFAASVIAGGLVYISQGLASQLRALRALEQYSALCPLAEAKLLELEAMRRLSSRAAQESSSGTYDVTGAGGIQTYEWTIAARARDDLDMDAQGRPFYSQVILTIQRAAGTGSNPQITRIELSVVWPMEWIPQNWLT